MELLRKKNLYQTYLCGYPHKPIKKGVPDEKRVRFEMAYSNEVTGVPRKKEFVT